LGLAWLLSLERQSSVEMPAAASDRLGKEI
jgi:hypothetical protein